MSDWGMVSHQLSMDAGGATIAMGLRHSEMKIEEV
jgi:hypothetical protein